MNAFKNVAMIGILAIVAFGMYVSINSSGSVETPPGVDDELPNGVPQVSLGAGSGAAGFSMEGPSGFPSPGAPPLQADSNALSPGLPFSDRGPAPPFSPVAPMPPEMASQLNAPPYPSSYAPSSPPIGSKVNLPGDPGNAPLPNLNGNSAPPLPPEISSYGMPGMNNPASPAGTEIRPEFAQFLAESRRNLEQGRLRETLAILSSRYGETDQTKAEADALTELLDQSAGTVIYSTQHHLEPAYVVQAGETLPQIAERYNVPAELLAKINRIADPMRLQPGQELKVVRGPFRAVVHLEKYEMVMWLQDLYAGRFPIGVGTDQADLTGNFEVQEKNREPTYYSPTSRAFDPNDPLNPLGKRRIGLGGPAAIHGTNDEGSLGQTGGPGAVRLGERDADDVFDILSLGSRVVIQR